MDYPTCHGNKSHHCCVFNGVDCPYIEENTMPGRRWACGLFRDLGNWTRVIKDPRYKNNVQPLFDSVPELAGMNCRDWPNAYGLPSGKCCYED